MTPVREFLRNCSRFLFILLGFFLFANFAFAGTETFYPTDFLDCATEGASCDPLTDSKDYDSLISEDGGAEYGSHIWPDAIFPLWDLDANPNYIQFNFEPNIDPSDTVISAKIEYDGFFVPVDCVGDCRFKFLSSTDGFDIFIEELHSQENLSLSPVLDLPLPSSQLNLLNSLSLKLLAYGNPLDTTSPGFNSLIDYVKLVVDIQDAPINLGWNIRSESSNPGDRPVDLDCGQVTNADFNIHGNGKISQNWKPVNALTNIKYQRQYMWPGGSNWTTDGNAYTNTYIPFSTFGSAEGTEGEWDSRVRAWVDVNGNNSLDEGIDTISGWSNQCSIIYDRTPPAQPTLESPTNDAFVNGNPTQTWSNIADAHHYIYESYSDQSLNSSIYSNPNISTNQRTVGGNQTISFWWRVKAVDSAGNESSWSNAWKLNVDNTLPTTPGIPLTSPNPTSNPSQDWSWTASTDNNDIAKYLWRIPGYSDGTDGTVLGTSLTTNLGEGSWNLFVKAQDNAENQSGESEGSVTVDTNPPAVPTGLRRLAKNDHNVIFACEDYAQIQGMHPDWDDNTEDDFDYYEYSSFNAPNGSIGVVKRRFDDSIFEYNGNWLPNEGTYGFAVRAVDKAGNRSAWALNAETLEGSCQITYDSTAPTDPAPSSTSHTVSTWSKDNTVDVTWSGANDNLSGVDGFYTEWNTSADTMAGTVTKEYEETDNTETSPILTDGNSHYFHIATVDNVGNWTNTEHLGPFWIDTTSPDAPILNNPADGLITQGIAFSQTWFSVSDATLYKYESCNMDPGDSNGLCTDFKWGDTYTGTTKNVGAGQPNSHFWWRVKARDAAGNWGNWSESRELIIDNDAPVSTITAPTGPDYFSSTITIVGNTTDNIGLASVQLSSALYTDSCGSFTNINTPIIISSVSSDWSYDWTPSAEGNYCIKAAGTDLAGNVESPAVVSNIIYDVTIPTVNWTSPQNKDTLVGTHQVLSSNSDTLAGLASVHYEFKKTSEPDTSYVTISEVTTAPFSDPVTWDTSLLDLDTYNLRLTVTDKAGNENQITREVGVAAMISSQFGSTPSFGEIYVSWFTDRPTTARVVYDTVQHPIPDLGHINYGYAFSTSIFDVAKTTYHETTLTGLNDQTIYYYRFISAGSPTAISGEMNNRTFSASGPGGSPSSPSSPGTGTPSPLVAFVSPSVMGVYTTPSVLPEEGEVLGDETTPTPVPEKPTPFEPTSTPEILGLSTPISPLYFLAGGLLIALILGLLLFRRR